MRNGVRGSFAGISVSCSSNTNLVPYLTVEENVMLPLSLAHRKADYVQVTQLLSRFGLRQRAKRR